MGAAEVEVSSRLDGGSDPANAFIEDERRVESGSFKVLSDFHASPPSCLNYITHEQDLSLEKGRVIFMESMGKNSLSPSNPRQTPCDLLIYGASQAVLATSQKNPEFWPKEWPVFSRGAVAVTDGVVVAVDTETELRRRFAPRTGVDLQNRLLAPGFVDAHTHPVFATGRAEEFDWRAAGMGYVEIAERGGGILSSVRAVRAASEEDLVAKVSDHFRRMLRHGTTTCEAKSGYALTTRDEIKSLRVIREAAAVTGMEVFPTFLGAHMVPAEYRERPDDYLSLLCEESLPAVREADLARSADIYIEAHAFNLQRARRYLERARELGFRLRVHAEQFEDLGGARLATELEAECADHLEALNAEDLNYMAASGKTFAGLLPAVPHFLRQKIDAPGQAILKARIPYFIATDFNPGTCYTVSIPEALHFARVRLNFSALDALAGCTWLAAASLGVGHRKGRIAPGYDADFVVLDLPDVYHLGYGFGENPVHSVYVQGRLWTEETAQ